MDGWVSRRDRVAALSLAGSLVLLGLAIVMNVDNVRLVAGLMIVVASLPIAFYYALDREAYDRAYSVGLFLLIALAGAVLAGVSIRLAAAAAIAVVAGALALSALRR